MAKWYEFDPRRQLYQDTAEGEIERRGWWVPWAFIGLAIGLSGLIVLIVTSLPWAGK